MFISRAPEYPLHITRWLCNAFRKAYFTDTNREQLAFARFCNAYHWQDTQENGAEWTILNTAPSTKPSPANSEQANFVEPSDGGILCMQRERSFLPAKLSAATRQHFSLAEVFEYFNGLRYEHIIYTCAQLQCGHICDERLVRLSARSIPRAQNTQITFGYINIHACRQSWRGRTRQVLDGGWPILREIQSW